MRPFGFWNDARDQWLTTVRAAKLFFVATLLIPIVTLQMFGLVNPLGMPIWTRVPWSILSMAGTVALFFIWFGMWRYWMKRDYSGRSSKAVWFAVMLLGFWFGSCVYYYCAYLPQVTRNRDLPA